MRAGNLDCERTVEILGEAYVQGRLDRAEYAERSSQALKAQTVGELNSLVADLPQAAPGLGSAPRLGGAAGRGWPAIRARTSLVLLLAAIACFIVGAATTSPVVLATSLSAGFLGAILAQF
jgi:hypothetical protein